MKVSIIVPVYNKSDCLRQCIESILSQSYKDIELILIDDGSTDSSLKICNTYKKDKRVVVISQKNMGVSAARNVGIKKSSGKFIMFVDADDYVARDYVEKFLNNSDGNDFVIGGYICEEICLPICRRTSDMRILLSRNNSKFIAGPVAKLFKASIIKNNRILFDENMFFGEDTCFVLDYIGKCETVEFIHYAGYYNRIIKNTLSRSYVKDIDKQLRNIYFRIETMTNNIFIKAFWYLRNIKLIKDNECKRMKVGIVTLIGNNNYGNRLQNYALSKVINNLGYRSYTIRIVGYDEGKKSFAKYIRYKYLFALKQCFMNGLVRTYKFRKFNKNILFYKNELSSIANTDKINDDFDCFVVGSDQVWNYKMASPVSVYFLEWADRNKRISYAASFGFDKVPREKSEEYRKLINGMRTISVREKTGSEIIKKITGRMDAKVLVDPTLLVQVDDWIALSKEPVKFKCLDGKKYILGFFLGGEEDAWKSEIQKIAEEHNYKIINLLDRKSLFYDSSPSEFLYLVQHAELVCTDSFHASVFAFIFDRPFVVFKRRGCGDYMYSRLQNLISTFRLRNREFSGEILRENLLVDYTEGKKILEKEREKSLKFLQDALEGCSD